MINLLPILRTTAVADRSPDDRIFTIAVHEPDVVQLALFDYSSAECNGSISAIRVGADPSVGGLGYFGHSSRMYQYKSFPTLSNDVSFTTLPLNWYLQPVPSPFDTYENRPNKQLLSDPNNVFGYADYCYGYDDSNNPAPPNISYCYPGNPWLTSEAIAPTNYADGVILNAFDNNGGRAPNKPFDQEPAIGGFRQCESNGTLDYIDQQGNSASAAKHFRYALVPICYLSRVEQENSCIDDPNGAIEDTSDANNRCRERGIYRFGLAVNRNIFQPDPVTGLSTALDQFGNDLTVRLSFLDSETDLILPSQVNLNEPGSAYYFTYQLTVVSDYTKQFVPIPTDLSTLCSYQDASSNRFTQRDPASQNRILTLISVEKRSPNTHNGHTRTDLEDYVYIYIGITPIWFHREISSGRATTLSLMAQLGGALTTIFTLLRVLRITVKFTLAFIYRRDMNSTDSDDEEERGGKRKKTITNHTIDAKIGQVDLKYRNKNAVGKEIHPLNEEAIFHDTGKLTNEQAINMTESNSRRNSAWAVTFHLHDGDGDAGGNVPFDNISK